MIFGRIDIANEILRQNICQEEQGQKGVSDIRCGDALHEAQKAQIMKRRIGTAEQV